MTEMEILEQIKTAYHNILQNKLTGIYVHGSIAFHCFRWDSSDIDFLVIVNQKVTLPEKKLLIAALLDLEKDCPPKGVEMSVVLAKYCQPFVYPTPFELHYSNTHREACRQNLEKYCMTMNGTDKDLAAHFTVTRKVGIVLYGKEIPEVFASVPEAAYLDSIRKDIENAVCEIGENPVYIILNLCRVLACVREGVVLSKKQGGEWALQNLPENCHGLVDSALRAYGEGGSLSLTEGMAHAARGFAEYMLEQIGLLSYAGE